MPPCEVAGLALLRMGASARTATKKAVGLIVGARRGAPGPPVLATKAPFCRERQHRVQTKGQNLAAGPWRMERAEPRRARPARASALLAGAAFAAVALAAAVATVLVAPPWVLVSSPAAGGEGYARQHAVAQQMVQRALSQVRVPQRNARATALQRNVPQAQERQGLATLRRTPRAHYRGLGVTRWDANGRRIASHPRRKIGLKASGINTDSWAGGTYTDVLGHTHRSLPIWR